MYQDHINIEGEINSCIYITIGTHSGSPLQFMAMYHALKHKYSTKYRRIYTRTIHYSTVRRITTETS